ncbi:cpsA domain protein [Mycobacterium xenopi 4042]|uniref:CpsA domain protein n=1 Tax=Mycobacterium xenopi 4042 TaxID=1299334 RepID=X7ZWW0_MYCXE|nr:cpsA domain protein [Mycobacterium xenopi 4042]
MSRILREHGYTPGEVRDRVRGEPTVTAIDYGAGAAPTPTTWRRCWASTCPIIVIAPCAPTGSASW